MSDNKENFIIYDIYGKIKYQSKNYNDFNGNNRNDFILYCINNRINLSYSNLSYVDLSYKNLSCLNLEYVNLSYTNLSYTNLSCVILENANLSNADLSYANLSYINFKNAKIIDTNFKNTNIVNTKMSIYCKWDITYKINENKEVIVIIGCKEKTVKQWDYFFSNKCKIEYETKRNSIEFKQIHAMYNAYKIYLKTMELI